MPYFLPSCCKNCYEKKKKKTIQAGKVISSYTFKLHSIEGIQDRNSREESGLEIMEKFCLFSHSLAQVAFLYSPSLPA